MYSSSSAAPTPAEAVRAMDAIVAANPTVPGLSRNWSVVRQYVVIAAPPPVAKAAAAPTMAPVPKAAAASTITPAKKLEKPPAIEVPGHVYLVGYNDSRSLKNAMKVTLKELVDRRVSASTTMQLADKQMTSEDIIVLFVYFSTPRSVPSEILRDFWGVVRARTGTDNIFLVRVASLQLASDSYGLPPGHVIDAKYRMWHNADKDIEDDLAEDQIGERLAAALAHVQRLGAPLCATGCGKPATQHNCGRTALVCSEVCCSALQND